MQFSVAVVVVSLAAFAVASDVETEKCAWGESYWCSDLRVAASCGAIEHCKTTVWKNQQLTADNTEVCEFCQTIVADVHKFLSDKKTEEDISHFLASACGFIPSETTAAECKVLVETFLPQIIDMITSEVSPQVVCSLLKLCTGLSDTVQHNPVVLSSPVSVHHIPLEKDITVKDSEICTDCKKFMSDIRNWLLSPEYLDQIEKMIDENVCTMFGVFENQCKELVHEFLPEIINATAQYYDPNVLCQPFCGASTPNVRDFFTRKTQSVEGCMLCKTVFGELQAMDRNVKIQTEITTFLKADLCEHLGTMKDGCVSLINRFAPSVFELLANLLDPDARCNGLGFCPAMSLAAVLKPVSAASTPVVKSREQISPECVLCEFIMKEIDGLLTDNATEAEIIAALDKVCSLMPSKVRQPCMDFVNTYGPAVIALLQQELDPAQICTFLGLCTSTIGTAPVVSKPVATVATADPELCIICETIVQYVEALLEENATVAEIEATVKKICNFLPDAMKPQCSEIIDKYGAIIIHLIATKYNPKEVCTLAQLCTASTASNTIPMMDLVPADKSSIVGTGQCSYGPAYWCASQKNAEQCGAVAHCKQYVWNN